MYRNRSVEFSPIKIDILEFPVVNKLAQRSLSKTNQLKTVINSEEIKEFLQREKNRQKSRWTSNKQTRDVSYLKDKLKPIENVNLQTLPTNIDHLKKLLESSN